MLCISKPPVLTLKTAQPPTQWTLKRAGHDRLVPKNYRSYIPLCVHGMHREKATFTGFVNEAVIPNQLLSTRFI